MSRIYAVVYATVLTVIWFKFKMLYFARTRMIYEFVRDSYLSCFVFKDTVTRASCLLL